MTRGRVPMMAKNETIKGIIKNFFTVRVLSPSLDSIFTFITDKPYIIAKTAANESWKEIEKREGGWQIRIKRAARDSVFFGS